MYARARAGLIQLFAGISDPYEVPTEDAVVLDIAQLPPKAAAQAILLHLEREGYIAVNGEKSQ